jgi:hypothetical protein
MTAPSPSFHRINYLVRSNKNIERKFVFEKLGKLSQALALSKHRYLGFGSLWFVDFAMAHRDLGIDDMWSFERAPNGSRAAYNKPYEAIRLFEGESTELLKKTVTPAEWKRPLVVWFDYDGLLRGDVVADIETLLEKAALESCILVTVNAVRKYYRPTTSTGELKQSVVETLKALLGPNVVPPRYLGHLDIDEKNCADFVAGCILNFMTSKVRKGGRTEGGAPIRFVPIFNYGHADAAAMVTVGGVLLSQSRATQLDSLLRDVAGVSAVGNAPPYTELDLIPLTVKEKIALDSLLPDDLGQFIREAQGAGIQLPPEELKKYWRVYKYFPVFAESLF